MNLRHYNWPHDIKFEDGSVEHLFFDDPKEFRLFIEELNDQISGEEGNFILSNSKGEISIKDNLILINDIFNLESFDRKIQNKINSLLKDLVLEDPLYSNSIDINSQLEKYAINIQQECDYPINYKNIEIVDIVKFLGFTIELSDGNILERITEYMDIFHNLCNVSSFVFINFRDYFSEEECNLLIEDSKSHKHNLLFINFDKNVLTQNKELKFKEFESEIIL